MGKGRHYKNVVAKLWQKGLCGRAWSMWNTLEPNLKIIYRDKLDCTGARKVTRTC
jgi:hypothetical protein